MLWAALNWRRDDTTKVVNQTSEIVVMLRAVIDELEKALDRAAAYGATTIKELAESRAECARLREELAAAYAALAELRHGG